MIEDKPSKSVILTFVRFYLPGYKSGGPVRTIANMVEHLGDDFEFKIVTLDRDATDDQAYFGVKADQWNEVGKAKVYYLSPENRTFPRIAKLIINTEHNLLYLNSFFDPHFSVFPLLARKLNKLPDRPVILAPRGEFSEGAVGLKIWKKRPFLKISKIFGLYNNITWQASSDYEKADIRRVLGNVAERIVVAPNLTKQIEVNKSTIQKKITNRPLRIVFLSRVAKKKNLLFALKVLNKLKVPIELDIYGIISDETYWQKCIQAIKELPAEIKVNYHGAIPHEQVNNLLFEYDLLFLPTLGENFGHVIYEALSVGLPVLISDKTPWRNLVKEGVGWDLPLDDKDNYVDAINQFANLNILEREKISRQAIQYAERISSNDNIEKNKLLFLNSG